MEAAAMQQLFMICKLLTVSTAAASAFSKCAALVGAAYKVTMCFLISLNSHKP